MEIYIFLLLFCLVASLSMRNLKLVGFIVIFTLFFLSASRGEFVGLDTENYYNNVFSSEYEGDIHSLEFLFIGFCDFIKDFELNPRCCIYFLSVVTFSFLYLASKRFGESLIVVCFFYLLLLFYTHSLNISRQMAACSILLYGYSFLFRYDVEVEDDNKNDDTEKDNDRIRNIVCFLLFLVLATSIHSGAFLGFVGLPVYFLYPSISKLFNRLNLSPFKVFLILVILFAFVQSLRGALLSRSEGLLTLIDMYEGYTTSETTISLFGFFYKSIEFFFHAFVLIYLFENGKEKLGTMFLFSLLLRIVLSAFYGAILRLSLYYSIIDVMAYSCCFINLITNKKMVFWLALLYWGIDYIVVLENNTYGTVPYVFQIIELL